MKYEIVEFSNGMFGVRKRNFFQNIFNIGGRYLDLKSYNIYFWGINSVYFKDSQHKDLLIVKEKYKMYINPVKKVIEL
jgi:hypothetical protein